VRAAVDVAVVDAGKNEYPDYLNTLPPGGLILADNVNISPAYREAITTNPAIATVFWAKDVGITMKKR
jgi:predicted O-methyltransferase YrrM